MSIHWRSWALMRMVLQALISLMAPWHHTHECYRVLRRGPECSWVLLSAYQCSSPWFNNEQKCELLKWPPSSIFEISWCRFYQIIKNWIVLKSTQIGLLKNVQDGISRPPGSREIQKTKVETDLLDTLYNNNCNFILVTRFLPPDTCCLILVTQCDQCCPGNSASHY